MHNLVEMCFSKEKPCETLSCLETVAKLILLAVRETAKEKGCKEDER